MELDNKPLSFRSTRLMRTNKSGASIRSGRIEGDLCRSILWTWGDSLSPCTTSELMRWLNGCALSLIKVTWRALKPELMVEEEVLDDEELLRLSVLPTLKFNKPPPVDLESKLIPRKRPATISPTKESAITSPILVERFTHQESSKTSGRGHAILCIENVEAYSSNNDCANCFASKGCKSSGCSPRPMNLYLTNFIGGM